MKTAAPIIIPVGRPNVRRMGFLGICLAVGMMLTAHQAYAQATVKTLGGGPLTPDGIATGFVDGDTLNDARFSAPLGMWLGPDANLWLADRDNGAIRKLLVSANQTRTVLAGLNKPVGIVFDKSQNFYVLTAGDNSIRKFDTNLNLLAVITTNLTSPVAFAIDSANNFFVAQGNQCVVRVTPTNNVIVSTNLVAHGFTNLGGIAVMNDTMILVSDAGNHALCVVDPFASAAAIASRSNVRILSGGKGAGLRNGDITVAQYDTPQGIMQAPNGDILVADSKNHQVRIVKTNGYAATFYGVTSMLWTNCVSCGASGASIWPGWADGTYDPSDPLRPYPAAKLPMSVLITSGGAVFVAEHGYHILRQVTGVTLTGSGGTGGGTVTEDDVRAPQISPESGYFPNGQLIWVTSLDSTNVYYTVDGTEPTTNSTRVTMLGFANRGVIRWAEALVDLSSLRVKAWNGAKSSATTTGKSAAENVIGPSSNMSTNYFVGPGSTVLIPLVANMISGTSIRSIFYRVEVTADKPTVPSISSQFRVTTLTPNDLITLKGVMAAGVATTPYFISATPSVGATRGLLVSAVGTNLGGVLDNYGVVNLIAVPIPVGVKAGDTYTLRVTTPSASSDGYEETVPISAGGAVTIQVGWDAAGETQYLVGDSSPSGWYNAGEFGNGNLNIADVNNAFYASLGLRVPPSFSDAFDAMDAFPKDNGGLWGGDGEIRFLDWQVILQRASRLDPNNYYRVRKADGISGQKISRGPSALSGSPDDAVIKLEYLPGDVWSKQAQLSAGSLGGLLAGQSVQVPVKITLAANATLSGMSFTAIVQPAAGQNGSAISNVQFVPASSALAPSRTGNSVPGRGVIPNVVFCVWDSISPVLSGETVLGNIVFNLPVNATKGQAYVVRFIAGSGGDMTTMPWRQPNFETIPGFAWVDVPVPSVPVRVSDEWQKTFFGGLDTTLGDLNADPDGDGVPNWQEYLAGTSPISRDSLLKLRSTIAQRSGARQVVLDWLSATGKRYVIEQSDSLNGGQWTPITTITGDGNFKEFNVTNGDKMLRFYRVRLAP